MPSADVVVLGAGPAGLAAAWWAARTGRSVVVLERGDAVGGLARSVTVGGVRADLGSHRLHPATAPHLLAALRGLLGDDLQTRPRNGRIRLAGQWLGFPLKPAALVRELPPGLAARAAWDAATAPLRRPRADTYAEVLRAGLGPALTGAFHFPYARKLWGLDPAEISAEQARVRVRADSPVKLAATVLRRGPRGRVFHYPRRGFGQIAEALADAAVGAGADIRLGAEVTAVDGARVTAGGTSYDAGRVLSTLPLTVLARLAGGPATPLAFRAMVLVHLVHGGGRWTSYDAHYLPGAETPVSRLSEPANYRVSADDPADRTGLCAEIPCGVGDAVWSRSDADLVALALDGVAACGLPPVAVVDAEVRRLPNVYPVYARGFEPHRAALDAWAADLPGVTSFGRLGLFAHDNTHHALAEAWDAVACLRGDAGWDAPAWATARRRFATHVVED